MRPGRGPTRAAPGRPGPNPETQRAARRAGPCSPARRRCGKRPSLRPVAPVGARRPRPATRTLAWPLGSGAAAARLPPAPHPSRAPGTTRAAGSPGTYERNSLPRPCRAPGSTIEAYLLQVAQEGVYGRDPRPGAAPHRVVHPRDRADVASNQEFFALLRIPCRSHRDSPRPPPRSLQDRDACRTRQRGSWRSDTCERRPKAGAS